eukprot:2893730-Rhodomonas_salina.2
MNNSTSDFLERIETSQGRRHLASLLKQSAFRLEDSKKIMACTASRLLSKIKQKQLQSQSRTTRTSKLFSGIRFLAVLRSFASEALREFERRWHARPPSEAEKQCAGSGSKSIAQSAQCCSSQVPLQVPRLGGSHEYGTK